jgi:hypothetical protein
MGDDVVERGGTVACIAEQIDMVYRGGLRCNRGGEFAMIGGADAPHGDQRAGADRSHGVGAIGAPPQQRKRRGDQARAQHAEQSQHGLDGVRHLQGDDVVALEPVPAQPRRDGRDGPIGFDISEPARGARREGLAIGRIGEGDGVRALGHGGTEQVVEGDAPAGA